MAGKKSTMAAITPYLAAIGNAEGAITIHGSKTNYELLAEQMWNWAMGWTEEVPVIEEGVVVKHKSVYHPPDKNIAKEIYARMEGKPKQTATDVAEELRAKVVPLTRKLDDQLKSRLNFYGASHVNESNGSRPSSEAATESKEDSADSIDPIPGPPRVVGVQQDRPSAAKRSPKKPCLP